MRSLSPWSCPAYLRSTSLRRCRKSPWLVISIFVVPAALALNFSTKVMEDVLGVPVEPGSPESPEASVPLMKLSALGHHRTA